MRCPRDDLVSLQISGLHDDCPLRRARLLNLWRKIHQGESRDQGRQDRSSHARLLHLECVYKTVECHWISNSTRPSGGVVFVDLPPGRRHVSCCVFSSPMLLPTAPSGHPVLSSSVVLFYFLPHLSNFFLPVFTTHLCCTRKAHCPPDDGRNHQFLSCPIYSVSRHELWQGLPQLSLKLVFFLI